MSACTQHHVTPAEGYHTCAGHEVEALRAENRRLRTVYEAARRMLRFEGVDAARTFEAALELDHAIEQVKLHDGGLAD